MTWQPIETFTKPEPKDEYSVLSERILLYFPGMDPPEAIGQCRALRAYGGIHYEWVEPWDSEPFETGAGHVEPSHWSPLLAPTQVTQQQLGTP